MEPLSKEMRKQKEEERGQCIGRGLPPPEKQLPLPDETYLSSSIRDAETNKPGAVGVSQQKEVEFEEMRYANLTEVKMPKEPKEPQPDPKLFKQIQEGVKHDGGKLQWHLVPWESMEEVVKVLMHGAEKYGAFNWKTIRQPEMRYVNAAMRHIIAWQMGNKIDESTYNHLAHAICSLLFLLHFDKE